MEKNLVSVCIPVYNGEATIKETLDSVISQTYKELEIIIVDNCSTDRTLNIVSGANDSRIRVYKNDTNLGMVGNWNKCLEYVRGSYIQFVCADDILYPECIRRKVEMMEHCERLSMVFGASEIIDSAGKVIIKRHIFKKSCIADGGKLAKRSYYLKNLYGEPSNVLFKAKLLAEAGNFALNTCYTTDWDMWLRLSCLGDVGYVNEILVKYRVSASNETSRIDYGRFLADDRVMMQNIESYHCMEINKAEEIIHHANYAVRMLARRLFMKLKC